MLDPLFQPLSPQISQGDILEIAPHLFLDPPHTRLIQEEPNGFLRASIVADCKDSPAEHQAIAQCRPRLAIIITYDCEIDKPAVKHWIVCPLIPLSDLRKEQHSDARRNRIARFHFLPRNGAEFPDSVVLLDQITTIHRSLLETVRRVTALSDDGRLGLYTHFIRWLTRWKFDQVKCPNCHAEFNSALAMSAEAED